MSFGTGQVDNWTGGSGTVPGGTTTYTVGGTLSGLSGAAWSCRTTAVTT